MHGLEIQLGEVKSHQLNFPNDSNRFFLSLRKMTLDKASQGTAIDPQMEDVNDGLEEAIRQTLDSRSVMRATDNQSSDTVASVPTNINDRVNKLEQLTQRTSDEFSEHRTAIHRLGKVFYKISKEIDDIKRLVSDTTSKAEQLTNSRGPVMAR